MRSMFRFSSGVRKDRKPDDYFVNETFCVFFLMHKRSFSFVQKIIYVLESRKRRQRMKEVYRMTKDELAKQYGMKGLTEEQAAKNLETYGRNELMDKARKVFLKFFLSQFADLLVIILIIASVISMISGNVESTIVIIAVIVLNAILGTVQYVKAQKSLDSLKETVVTESKSFEGWREERNTGKGHSSGGFAFA